MLDLLNIDPNLEVIMFRIINGELEDRSKAPITTVLECGAKWVRILRVKKLVQE